MDDQSQGRTPPPEGWLHHPSGGLVPAGPDVGFNRSNVGPPALQYIEVDDTLQWSAWSVSTTIALTLSMRVLTAQGFIIPVFLQLNAANGGITPSKLTQTGVAGYILSATITARTVNRGAVYTTLEILRGLGSGDATQGTLFIAGYPNRYNDVAYPTMGPEPSDAGMGLIVHQTVANPAPGADWSFTVPAGTHVRVVGVKAQLVTAAAAANRVPVLQLSDGTNVAAAIPSSALVLASTTAIINWHPGDSAVNVTAGALQWMSTGLPSWNRLYGGGVISTLTSLIQAADQWSNIVLELELWNGQ